MHTVYILYSDSTDAFYIGQTVDLDTRILKHNNHTYSKAETKKATDWVLFFRFSCKSRTQAIRIEQHIKKMKSRQYLFNIKRYPEIVHKLLEKYP